ncbi:MAG: hypothetical protein HY289_14635 [Planctomycetes bacterium]|nr:hypothetical protein [Planctomycetota bacterium]
MSTITADRKMKSLLSGVIGAAEIRDADGTLLGVYTPTSTTADEVRKLFDLKKARKALARERDQGRPLREILNRLKAKEKRAPSIMQGKGDSQWN